MKDLITVEVSDWDRKALQGSNYNLSSTTFVLVPLKGGMFKLRDTDKFNKWKCWERFATKDEAVVYAWRSHDFKTGHRQHPDLCKA